jgi:hypothetical protein
MVTIRVLRVEPVWRLVKGVRKRKFTVWPELPDRHAYETWDAWQASLCQRAGETGKAVRLSTRDTRWGPEIVNVELVKEQASA